MKKLTLDETWVQCLEMWEWIAEQVKAGKVSCCDAQSIADLKRKWLKKRRITRGIPYFCFFCEYSDAHGGGRWNDNDEEFCPACPARLVSRSFHCESRKSYNWQDKPIAFYNKLVALNKKTLKGTQK